MKSVVTFSSPGIEKSITYEGVTYDFSGTIAETVHHYLDSGDTMMQLGSYYIEGDIYLYGCNYYLDQAGDSGKVVRFKDYLIMVERVMRELGRRIKKIAYGWSDKGVTKIARIILKRFANAIEWEEYCRKLMKSIGNVVISLGNYQCFSQNLGQ